MSGTITPSTDIMVPRHLEPQAHGLGVGDKFRLIFLSSTKRNASSSSIGDYNTLDPRLEPQPAMTTSRHTAMASQVVG